jgi:hypothetical protein
MPRACQFFLCCSDIDLVNEDAIVPNVLDHGSNEHCSGDDDGTEDHWLD